MKKVFVNPFAIVQRDGSESYIVLTSSPDNIVKIFNPEHPLYGINNIENMVSRISLLQDTDIDFLCDRNIISFRPFDRDAILSEIYQREDSQEFFSLTIFPTLNCNNACVYCYQKHDLQPRMTKAEYKAIYNLVLRKIDEKTKRISLNLMGGEPTLETRMLLPFVRQCLDICSRNDVVFNASLTTNGRIMNVGKFVTAGINEFQITIDGPEETHNRLRPGSKGEGTFGTIMKHLISLRDKGGSDIGCTIRVNHTIESIASPALHSFLSFLSRYFKKDKRFEIFHNYASDLGGDIDTTILIPKDGRRNKLEYINTLTREYDLFTKSDVYIPNGRVCYAARNNAVTILPGFKLLKCTVAIDERFNHVGTLLPEGELEYNENYSLWVDDNAGKKECGTCEVAPICQGRSCPLKRIKFGKNPCPDVKYDNTCFIRTIK